MADPTQFLGAYFNDKGDQANFNDQDTASAFVDTFGGEIERVGVAFAVTDFSAESKPTKATKNDTDSKGA